MPKSHSQKPDKRSKAKRPPTQLQASSTSPLLNRPEIVAQRKRQEMVNNSSQVLQLKAIQDTVVQRVRNRRKAFKTERKQLGMQKRMAFYHESVEQMQEEQTQRERMQQERKKQAYERKFDSYLRRGMALILGEDQGGIGFGVRFGGFWDAYDKKYWKVVTIDEEEEDYELVLKSGVSPSAAIDFLFKDLSIWAFDCADSIQVARWYAMRHAMGARAFNRKMHSMKFTLRSHGSTGLQSERTYSRVDREGYYDKNETLKFSSGSSTKTIPMRGSEGSATAKGIIERAPIGTRLMLTVDDDSAGGTDFENENMVKIGNNRYAAHPLGVGTLDFITTELAKTVLSENNVNTNKENIHQMKKKIYISEIEFIKKR